MSFWTGVFLICCLIAATQMYKAHQRREGGIVVDERGNEREIVQENQSLNREVAELRERIKVLERIATDANTGSAKRLSDDIEKLRDDRD